MVCRLLRLIVASAALMGSLQAFCACALAQSTLARPEPPQGGGQREPERLESKKLPNAIRVHDKVISGGQPEGEKAFEELAKLGVKTIISVDGGKPNIEAARRFGLRYVHLPHGYDGVPEDRVKELAKAIKELPGPVYIHCHHGKHRSPTATAVACVAAGFIDPSMSVGILKLAGTNEGYRGLYASARSAKRIDDKILGDLKVDFPEVAKTPAFVEAMVALEHTHDHLKAIAAANWKSPPDHPDLDPAHEALLLQEHFTEMLRAETASMRPASFLDQLKTSESASRELGEILGAKLPAEERTAKAKFAFETVTKQCATCHKSFRDVPLSEKTK